MIGVPLRIRGPRTTEGREHLVEGVQQSLGQGFLNAGPGSSPLRPQQPDCGNFQQTQPFSPVHRHQRSIAISQGRQQQAARAFIVPGKD
jgi:hypothetical protein